MEPGELGADRRSAMGDDEGKTRRWIGDEDGGDDHGQGVQRENEGGGA